MRRFIRYCIFAFALFAATFLNSCSDDYGYGVSSSDDEVVFGYVINDMKDGDDDATSRAVVDDGTAISQIQNMWVVEFLDDGTYVASNYYDAFNNDRGVLIDGTTKTIVFIANTFDDDLITNSPNLTAVKGLTMKISANDDVLGTDGTDQYCIMYGTISNYVRSAGGSVTLTRNCARVNIKVDNNLPAGIFELSAIETLNLPTASYVYPIYTAGQNYPAEVTSANAYSWISDDITLAASQTGKTIYLPINRRGKSNSASSSDKSNSDFAFEGATAIRLTLVNESTTAELEYKKSIYYTFYLGEDMISDYNITENNSYNYTFTINAVGSYKDPRIEVEYLLNKITLTGTYDELDVEDSVVNGEDGFSVDDYDDSHSTSDDISSSSDSGYDVDDAYDGEHSYTDTI